MPLRTDTPMMRQYNHFKSQYQDEILLFRMGDFYETFGEDAQKISKVLNIALTSRDKNSDPTPLAGFPHHALDQYLPKIVKAGYHVAIADQVEDPKLAKGIVRREITRVVSPGTLSETTDDKQAAPTFLVSLFKMKQAAGIAVCNLATGSLQVTETSNSSEMIDEIARIAPAEILVPPGQDFSSLTRYRLQVFENYDYSYDFSKTVFSSQFGTRSTSSFGIAPYRASFIAACALISYIKDTQRTNTEHISSIAFYDIHGKMILDQATIRNLELISSESEHDRHYSLNNVLDHTTTGMGSRQLRSWILHPLLDTKEINKRLDCIEFFHSHPDDLSHTIDILNQISDIERICGRLGLNRANARDLLNLSQSISAVNTFMTLLEPEAAFADLLKILHVLLPNIHVVRETIEKSISDSPPLSITEGNIIRDGFNSEIDTIRQHTSDSTTWIAELEVNERKRTGISSLKVRMNKVFGYYIEVTNAHKDKVPDNYIRKQTLVNGERYITPELKEKEEIVLNAQERLALLEYECFQKIRESIVEHIQTLQQTAAFVADIDVFASLATTARLNDYSRPTLAPLGEDSGRIEIKQSRHPIVELSLKESFIPNDITLDRSANRLLVLTGPNMSGKSTYIRQIAMLILMAQIGSFVPARSAHISIVDRIFTRVGASDDLSGGRSTFMVEMDEAANIINNATQHSFIVLDEVGRGTSTYDGVSIAWAIAEHIHNVLGARCLFATHYHELLKLETELDGVRNFNVAVLEENNSILFLHKIEEGGTDRSYGIYVAQMSGLPASVIERAQEILNGFEQENMFSVRTDPSTRKKETAQEEKLKEGPKKTTQLSFIDSTEHSTIPNMYNEIKSLDVNGITPIEALQLLEKWKKRIGT